MLRNQRVVTTPHLQPFISSAGFRPPSAGDGLPMRGEGSPRAPLSERRLNQLFRPPSLALVIRKGKPRLGTLLDPGRGAARVTRMGNPRHWPSLDPRRGEAGFIRKRKQTGRGERAVCSVALGVCPAHSPPSPLARPECWLIRLGEAPESTPRGDGGISVGGHVAAAHTCDAVRRWE